MATTAAQDEFNTLVANSTPRETLHPEDRSDPEIRVTDDTTEEDDFQRSRVDAAMRAPSNNTAALHLPPASFDSGRSTGVKGVIADARSYETARRGKWKDRAQAGAQAVRRSIFGLEGLTAAPKTSSDTDDDARSGTSEDDTFLDQWRDARRKELEEDNGRGIRNRRTSPSVREYGRLDEVDALGYLDAIEKVRRETTVVVFVYDNECEVSAAIESAMLPLVRAHRPVHFVKVHYDDIEFDAAAVPSILAYRNQGDLVANLTGLIEMFPDDDHLSTDSLKILLQRHSVL